MKRSDFLKRFGLGVVAAIVTPEIIKGEINKPKQLNGTDLIVTKEGYLISGDSLKKITLTPRKLKTEIKVSDEFMNTFTSTSDDSEIYFYTDRL